MTATPASGASEGLLAVLFTDVVGSARFAQEKGDTIAREALSMHRLLVRQRLTEFDGREIETAGDSFLATFTSVRRALFCALAIQVAQSQHNARQPDRALEVRIGLSAGEVPIHDEGVYGSSTVNVAARVMAKAGPGELLVSEVVRTLAGHVPTIAFVSKGRRRLKGLSEPVHILEVSAVVPIADASPVPVTGFVGRQAEKDLIVSLLGRATGGQGAIVVIGGEPGVGKTRLAEEVKAEARRRGFQTMTGHCVETEGGLAYMPFVEIIESQISDSDPTTLRDSLGEAAPEVARIVPRLRRLFPDIGQPLKLPPEQERRYLLNSVQEFIARAGRIRPQLAIVEDLHWADEATLILLRHIAERIDRMPLVILATYRDIDIGPRHPLAKTLENLLRGHLAHRVSLSRFPLPAVAEMCRDLGRSEPPPALVDAIYAETDGNPLFVEEVFRHLKDAGRLFDDAGGWRDGIDLSTEDVPTGVRLVIEQRLDRLSEDTQRLLAIGATIGRIFNYQMLEAISSLDSAAILDALEAALRAGLIRSVPTRSEVSFIFAHELTRQTLLSNVSIPRRQRWHVQIADELERSFGEEAREHASEIAHNLVMAGKAADRTRTATYLTYAGDRAELAAAYEDALRSYEMALDLMPPETSRQRAELLAKVGLARMIVGDWAQVVDIFEQAVSEFEALGDGPSAGRLCVRMAWLQSWHGQFEKAWDVAARGFTALGDARTGERAALLDICGIAISLSGGHDLAEEMILEAIRISADLGDQARLAESTGAMAIHRWAYGKYVEAVDIGTQAIGLLRDQRMLWDMANVMGFVEFCEYSIGRFSEALALHEEQSPLAIKIGHHGALMVDLFALIGVHLAVGDWKAAEETGQQHVGACIAGGLPWIRDGYTLLAGVAFARGDWDGAIALCRQAGEYDFLYAEAAFQPAAHFMYLAYSGNRQEAIALLERFRSELPILGEPSGWGAWNAVLFAIEGLVSLGLSDSVAELAPLAEAIVGELGWVRRNADARSTRVLAGVATAAAGDWERAREYFRLGRADSKRLGLRSLADCDYFEGRSLLTNGRYREHRRARELLRRAATSYRSLGMPRHYQLALESAEFEGNPLQR